MKILKSAGIVILGVVVLCLVAVWINEHQDRKYEEFAEESVRKAGSIKPCWNDEGQPESCWSNQGSTADRMDGTVRGYLQTFSEENVSGSPEGENVRALLEVRFWNGKLYGVSLDARGYVGDEPKVRVKFDDEKPTNDTWHGWEDHHLMGPSSEKSFVRQLLKHQKLMVEFSYYDEPRQTITFEIRGLEKAIKDAGWKLP